jgi:hypothetical protein
MPAEGSGLPPHRSLFIRINPYLVRNKTYLKVTLRKYPRESAVSKRIYKYCSVYDRIKLYQSAIESNNTIRRESAVSISVHLAFGRNIAVFYCTISWCEWKSQIGCGSIDV